jgi:uncharacterized protein
MPIAGFRFSALIVRNSPGCVLAVLCLGLPILPAAAVDRAPPAAALQPAAVAEAAAVAAPNCLLPGRIRSVGGIAMLAPRRPVTLAPTDCAARGGEPIGAADPPPASP